MSEELKPVAWLFVCESGPYAGEIDVHSRDGESSKEADRVSGFYGAPFPVIRLSDANTLIEEQAARIAELEKERDVAWESREWHRVSMECQTENLIASQARLSEAVKVLEELGAAVSIYRLGVKDTVPKIAAGDPGDMATINALMANNGILDAATSKAKAFITTLGETK